MKDVHDNKSTKKDWRDTEVLDKLLNNPTVEAIMNDTSHEGWCTNCGNTQGVNHLGSQKCINCGKSEWMDAYSFRKMREAQKDNLKEIGNP